MFRKVLIANRGEIAVRVIRTCRDLGIETVAVFSEADRGSLHVRMADEAYCVGPPAPLQSYLDVDRILEVARRSGADALHPGYGFLSENPRLSEACASAGVTFIGPDAHAMRVMGDKLSARNAMAEAEVPIVPGSKEPLEDEAGVRRWVEEYGYPLLLKAAAGGGGRGMRIIRSAEELRTGLSATTSEARTAFGDGRVYVERYVDRPRHIEVQVMADGHGNVIHLGERECSIQRRHQKVIEEAPSPVIDEATRQRLGELACRAAAAVDYRGAGTIEFLMDPAADEFYFMEMNTRLQVEHPVTEMITGLDLVEMQLRVAAGEPLPLTQADVRLQGWSIECRIYAEDPDRGFAPSPGKILRMRIPEGPGVRHDGGFDEGSEVGLDYDAMLAKLVVWGPDRRQAIRRMARALAEYEVAGVITTIGFHGRVIEHPEFVSGDIDTGFLDRLPAAEPATADADLLRHALLAAAVHARSHQQRDDGASGRSEHNPWKMAGRRAAMRVGF